MPLIKLLLVVIILFTLISCSWFVSSKFDKPVLLNKFIKDWNIFRLDGIAEINYKTFSFRKNIQIRKIEDRLRLDIFDSGFLGMNPSPFLTAYVDSMVYYKFSDETYWSLLEFESEKIKISDLDLSKIIEPHFQEILTKKYLEVEKTLYSFNDQMKLTELFNSKHNLRIRFEYQQDNLYRIEIEKDNKEIANIKIDKISRAQIKVKKPKIAF